MPTTFDSRTQRHPTATRLSLTLGALVLTNATVLAVLTGHTALTAIGIAAFLGTYLSGYSTAAHRYQQRLAHKVAEARKDPLTGLPNRALADEMLDAASRAGASMTVALIDINGLHTINGNLGLAAGDQYLTTVARRLAQAVPPNGLLVRQGGDEFTLLAWNTDPQDLADRIGAALAGRAIIAGYRIQPRASVGIAATNTAATAEETVDAHHARARADSAMYTAKRDGGNQIRIFDPDRDPEPSPDGTRPLVRRRDINPIVEAGMSWLPTLGDELIPLLLSPDDLRTVAQALTTAADRWTRAAAEAAAGRPASAPGSEPGRMNIEPTPAGYAGIARLAGQQQARYTQLLQRLQPIIETAEALDGAGHAPTSPSATAPAMSCVVLVGISAAFTPADLDALVITAAEAVYGQPDDLSSRQRELAARAYALLQDAIDD